MDKIFVFNRRLAAARHSPSKLGLCARLAQTLQYIAKETQGERFTSFYISRKLPIVALICTVFITYPNVVWIPWNLARLNVGEEPGFWAFFALRMIYFYGLFFFQLRYNVRKIGNMSFAARFGRNFIYTLVGCAAFVGLSYGLPLLGIQTGYVGNILLFQFFVVCLLCTFIGYISVLDARRYGRISFPPDGVGSQTGI